MLILCTINAERKCLGLEEMLPIFSFKIGSFPINITIEIVIQWGVILILGIDKKQVVIESL